ncbi:twinfilin-2-like [Ciona intestinalis]
MSHQTGISCNDELKDVFRDCTTEGGIRAVKIAITDETLECSNSVDKLSDSWEADFDDVVGPLLVDKQPCYILLQLQDMNTWLFIVYSPDDSPTRQKMLYAATRSTLKSEFGGGFITDELFGTKKDEVSYAGYQEYLTHKHAPPPLTNAEEELKFLDETEDRTPPGVTTRHQTVQGLAFPITDDAQGALQEFKEGLVNHIEMNVDLEKETIFKVSSSSIGASDLEELISKDRAGYHLFNYAHRHDNEDISSVFFIYSMPGSKIPIKARMLFSSCKSPLIETIEAHFEIKINKRVECDCSDKLTEEFLRNEIHPPTAEARHKFTKPKGPGRRAPARRPKKEVENGE